MAGRVGRWGLVMSVLVLGGCVMFEDSRDSGRLTRDEAVRLIDSMRDKGSFEEMRERVNASARAIAEQIVAAIPGQTWEVDDDPEQLEFLRGGTSCEKLTGDIARRPSSDRILFGRNFTPKEYAIALDIVRNEAVKYGVTAESSLFDEGSRHDRALVGNGYEFELMQIERPILIITGDCFLMQRVLDLPPGQLPPDSPLNQLLPPTGR